MNVQAPAVQAAVPFWVLAPLTTTETVALSPAAVPHAPPTDVAATFVVYGKVRAVPLTDRERHDRRGQVDRDRLAAVRAGVAEGVRLRRGHRVDAGGGQRGGEGEGPGARGAGAWCRSACSHP